MPIHDWSRVEAGIFHDFHQTWTIEIKIALNRLLPRDYYAMAEQRGDDYTPDVLTLKSRAISEDWPPSGFGDPGADLLVAEPRTRVRAEADMTAYRRKQNVVTVRHASGDELVAMVELVSRGNKSGRVVLDDFVTKAVHFLHRSIHLLIVDLQPPTKRDPQGIHGRIWEAINDDEYQAPEDKPLTLASYEAAACIRAFVEPVAVGDAMIDMPLFLRHAAYVPVPLEETYQAAWEAVPRRWREVIAPPA